MAHVVVAGPRRGAGQHRKDRRSPVECLDLGLLVHAQHERPFGWVEVQPDDVADLGHEQRVLGQFPRILFVGCQSERPPYPRHHRLAHPQMLGHRPRRPVRGIGRRGLQRGHDQRLDPIIADHPRPARARLVDQPVEANSENRLRHAAPCRWPGPDVRRVRCWIHHRLLPTRFAPASPDPAALVRRRAQPSNSARSSSVNTISNSMRSRHNPV